MDDKGEDNHQMSEWKGQVIYRRQAGQDALELFVEDQQPDAAGQVVDPRFEVRGTSVTVSPGDPVVVPLEGQGPAIEGTPPPVAGRRRADGTVIAAIVPGR